MLEMKSQDRIPGEWDCVVGGVIAGLAFLAIN